LIPFEFQLITKTQKFERAAQALAPREHDFFNFLTSGTLAHFSSL